MCIRLVLVSCEPPWHGRGSATAPSIKPAYFRKAHSRGSWDNLAWSGPRCDEALSHLCLIIEYAYLVFFLVSYQTGLCSARVERSIPLGPFMEKVQPNAINCKPQPISSSGKSGSGARPAVARQRYSNSRIKLRLLAAFTERIPSSMYGAHGAMS